MWLMSWKGGWTCGHVSACQNLGCSHSWHSLLCPFVLWSPDPSVSCLAPSTTQGIVTFRQIGLVECFSLCITLFHRVFVTIFIFFRFIVIVWLQVKIVQCQRSRWFLPSVPNHLSAITETTASATGSFCRARRKGTYRWFLVCLHSAMCFSIPKLPAVADVSLLGGLMGSVLLPIPLAGWQVASLCACSHAPTAQTNSLVLDFKLTGFMVLF